MNPHPPDLRSILDDLVIHYDRGYIESDPIKFVHRFDEPPDREWSALLASSLAFGNVKAIFTCLEKLFDRMGRSPMEFLLTQPKRAIQQATSGIYHRWVTSEDLSVFFQACAKLYRRRSSLEAFFVSESDLECGMNRFSSEMKLQFSSILGSSKLTRGLAFLIPNPKQKSVCKRLNLFLRWMVRRTSPDLGLWTRITPGQLFLPMDVHLTAMMKHLNLVPPRAQGWSLVRQATERLCLFDPQDPVKYDFALSRLGILGKCLHRYEKEICKLCPVRNFCMLYQSPTPMKSPH